MTNPQRATATSKLATTRSTLTILSVVLVSVVVIAGCSSTSVSQSSDRSEDSPVTAVTTSDALDQALSASDSVAADSAADGSVTTVAPESTTTSSSQPEPPTTVPVLERAIPTEVDSFIAELTQAELAIRDTSVSHDEAMLWGQRQQRLYRVLADNPDWGPAVVAGVDATVQFGVEKNWEARKALNKLVRSATLAETLPAWQLRQPLPVDELLAYYNEAETLTGIPWNYLAAINLVETRMGRIEGFSTAGATGPMQFLPSTWEECCEGDPTLDRDAIIGAGTYLVRVGGLDDLQKALYRYNNSDRYVNSVTFYAEVMAENPLAYRGYHAWQVYFLSTSGLILMPPDYYQPEPVPVDEWLLDHPDALID